MIHKLLLVTLTLFATKPFAQTKSDPKIFRFKSAYTSFPDTGRAKGHFYENVLYSPAEHYNDSTVLIIVPPKFKVTKNIDVICWFHGWNNNIDSVPARFDVIKQFLAAHRNAILVLAETAKDAPDSYGGKLEKKNIFKLLLDDILNTLKEQKIIGKKAEPGKVVLAGHSGAFRVIAHILQNGGVEVQQTILFDALYSQIDKFTNWIQSDTSHQFINIYTNNGGTDEVSVKMMQILSDKNVLFINPEEKELNASILKTNNIIFIHSLKEHNDVINRPDYNLELFIENNHSLQSIRD